MTTEGYKEVADTFNAYCDFDGKVKQQKVKENDGSWASCQNNYECESNLCSGGDCIEINDMLVKAEWFESIGTRIACWFSNMFGIQDFDQCVYEKLGE